jgi:hypothetical protein
MLQRQGQVSLISGNGDPQTETQDLYLASGRLGLEAKAIFHDQAKVLPLAGFTLVPMLAVSNRSLIGDDTTTLGVGLEVNVGMLFELSRMLGVSLKGTRTWGWIDGAALSGFGVLAGARVVLE